MKFISTVQEAVSQCLTSGKPLLVYATDSTINDTWLNDLVTQDMVELIKEHLLLLKIIKETPDFDNFLQLFPKTLVPSVSIMSSGKVLDIIHGEITPEMFAERICKVTKLEVEQTVTSSHGTSQATMTVKKTLKEECVDISAKVYQEKMKKLRLDEKRDRERVLRQIKADRDEQHAKHFAEHGEVSNEPVKDNIKNPFNQDYCGLSLRLTNGQAITHTFRATDTLDDVRKWLETNRTDGDVPYAFHRSIPRVTFGVSDERKSLTQLQLLPRSAIILKPIDSGKVTAKSGEGLVNRMYHGLSSWWNPEPVTSTPNQPEIESDFDSPSSSKYASPFQSPKIKETHLSSRPSNLSLTRGGSSQNIHMFEATNDEDIVTYNGNHVNLEDDKKHDSSK